MISREAAAPYAGAIAASGIAVAKQLQIRNSSPAGLSSRVQPAGLGDLPRLFRQSDARKEDKVARLSSAALLYSVDKRTPKHSAKVLKKDESAVLNKLHAARVKLDPNHKLDRSCPHCRLLLGTMYPKHTRKGKFPPIAVVNHS